jgi:hypothetical protein
MLNPHVEKISETHANNPVACRIKPGKDEKVVE